MKNKKRILTSLVVTVLLLVASISYLLLSDRDSYKYYTGLGSGLAISEDDQSLAFSYYKDGREAIYVSESNGKNAKKVTHSTKDQHRDPKFSPDGSKLLFLSRNAEGIQSLFITDQDGSNPKKLSSDAQHVSEAIFSKDGSQIYFSSMPAKDFKEWEAGTDEGFDLFSVDLDGKNLKQLTDDNRLAMESIALSPNGKEILFKDNTDLYTFNIEKEEVSFSEFTKLMPSEPFYLTLSPKRNAAAYTAVSKESKNSSLFEYELFLKNLENGEITRLTNLKKAVVSPVFFHSVDKILFLEHTNWPQDPNKFKLMTVNLDSKKMSEISLDLPASKASSVMMQAVDYTINSWTIGLLYSILLFLLTLYMKPNRVFLPSSISLSIAVLSIAASFIVAAMVDPWIGIGVGMLSVGIWLCTLASFLFAFGIKFYRKQA
ncbi:DPP IV N-terminal domain-containing protein [Bacillus sp. JJ1122]|uniref:TolB family protein n=1 Tax=Bacillus sp. JJ1122 TaxID=3122951 RepID=UPI002FFFC3CF